MKKIDFEVFGPGQYLYFDIGRLIQVENITGKSAGDIIRNQELNLGILTALLSIGLRQHGIKNPQWYATKMQELIDQGHEMEEFVQPVVSVPSSLRFNTNGLPSMEVSTANETSFETLCNASNCAAVIA